MPGKIAISVNKWPKCSCESRISVSGLFRACRGLGRDLGLHLAQILITHAAGATARAYIRRGRRGMVYFAENWCPRRDSNSHGMATGGF